MTYLIEEKNRVRDHIAYLDQELQRLEWKKARHKGRSMFYHFFANSREFEYIVKDIMRTKLSRRIACQYFLSLCNKVMTEIDNEEKFLRKNF